MVVNHVIGGCFDLWNKRKIWNKRETGFLDNLLFQHVVSDENLKTGGYGGGQKQRSASTVDAYLAIERIAGRHTHHPVAIAVMVLLSQGNLAVKHVVTVRLLPWLLKEIKRQKGRKGEEVRGKTRCKNFVEVVFVSSHEMTMWNDVSKCRPCVQHD